MDKNNLLNEKFGKLTVKSFAYSKYKRVYWNCDCSCGNTICVTDYNLLNNKIKSCGCFYKIKISEQEIIDAHNDYIFNNITPSELAKKFDCHQSTILKLFKECGFKIKNRGFANRKFIVNETIFDSIDSEEKAYWLGFLYADGNVISKNRTFTTTLALAEEDKDMVTKFSKFIFGIDRSKIFKSNNNDFNRQKIARVVVCSKYLVNSLKNKGCVPNKTFLLKFPNFLDKKLYNHFIRGYFDGDGCIGFYLDKKSKSKKARFNIVSTKDLINSISYVFDKELNIKTSQSATHRVDIDKNNITLWISSNFKIERVMEWLYNDATIFMNRKYDIYLEIKKYNLNSKKKEMFKINE